MAGIADLISDHLFLEFPTLPPTPSNALGIFHRNISLGQESTQRLWLRARGFPEAAGGSWGGLRIVRAASG
jgi:hypothetical protein